MLVGVAAKEGESSCSMPAVPAGHGHGRAAVSSIRVLLERYVAEGKCKEAQVLKFMRDAGESDAPFEINHDVLGADVVAALRWRASVTAKEAMAFREQQADRIVRMGAKLREEGDVLSWFSGADPGVVKVAGEFNGPLATSLAGELGYGDAGFVELFREGGKVVGRLPQSGCGVPAVFPEPESIDSLWGECRVRNEALLANLAPDTHAQRLLDELRAEADKGLVKGPLPVGEVDLDRSLLAKRFSVEQGRQSDGSIKIRAVDDERRSGTNARAQPTERLSCDGVDFLLAMASFLASLGQDSLSLWKADIKSAYRRVPVCPEQKWLLWVVVMVGGDVWAARHNAMPFGCTGGGMPCLPLLFPNNVLMSHVAQAVCMLGTVWGAFSQPLQLRFF